MWLALGYTAIGAITLFEVAMIGLVIFDEIRGRR